MSNLSSIMAAAYLDHLCTLDAPWTQDVGSMDSNALRGSLYNPLRAMGLITIDPRQGNDYGSERLAEAVGVPADWFDADHLTAPIDEVIAALGKMALIYLSSLRSAALAYGFEVDAKEECLKAEATLADVLAMNGKLARGLSTDRRTKSKNATIWPDIIPAIFSSQIPFGWRLRVAEKPKQGLRTVYVRKKKATRRWPLLYASSCFC